MKFITMINIEDTISDMVGNCQMFTAYDVTKTLRHEGFRVRHSEVRDAVRDFDFPSKYQEGVDNKLGAIVHYYMNDDIGDYESTTVPEFIVSGSTALSSPSVAVSPSIVDKRHRYCVPAAKLRDAGFMKGMHVKILVDHDKIVIHNGNDGAEVTVDKSNNIRISKGTLQNAFDSVPVTINIDVSSGRVELSIDD